jgi:hypothetical protein
MRRCRSFISDNNASETALGGVEVGGLYIPQLASDQVGLVLRAGVVLPTAEKGEAAFAGLLATFL